MKIVNVGCCAAENISLKSMLQWLLMISFSAALMSCGGSSGSSGNSEPKDDPTVEYEPLDSLEDASFSATRLSIVTGESSLLSWSVPTATSVEISPINDNAVLGITGELTVTPAVSTDYLLLARVEGVSKPYGKLVSITVKEVAAVSLLANVESGFAPLNVRFTPSVSSITNISRYYWDFEGDGGPEDGGLGTGNGGFDTLSIRTGGFTLTEYDTIGRTLNYTFEKAGTYTTRIRVWDDDGNQADAQVTIEVINAPPAIDTLNVTSSLASGQVPLSVTFEVEAADADGIDTIEWDLDGNGTYDATSEVRLSRGVYSSRFPTVFDVPGVYSPSVRVTDSTGLSTVSSAPSIRVEASELPIPTVSATGSIGGIAPYEASFNVSISDPGRSGIRAARIDFEGDGTFDESFEVTGSSRSIRVEHLYESAGVFYLYIEVLAEDGGLGKRYVEVIVEADHSLTVTENAIDPLAGELAEIELEIGGSTRSEIMIVDDGGQAVASVGGEQQRTSGEYTLNWDGRTQAGDIAKPGIYFAVLNYQVGDAELVLDLRDDHSVLNYYPSIRVPSAELREGTQPFANKPIVYPFELDNYGINRLTAYMTQRGSNVLTSSASIFQARYVEDGEYTIEWLGDGVTGKLLPVVEATNDYYVPGVIAESVAANAILLTHETSIGDITIDKPIFHPSLINNGSGSEITFNLSHAAAVELTVASTDSGAEVLRKTFANVPAGSASVSWDGRDNAGNLLAPAGYRLQLTAFGPYGDTSLPASVMQRIRY